MAKGLERHQEYVDALNLLGKALARRARSRCELSGESGTLGAFDLIGAPTEPSLEHVLLVCPAVRDHLEGRNLGDRDALRYLDEAVWSTEPVVRAAAVRILEQIDAPWAHDALENARSMDAYASDDDEG